MHIYHNSRKEEYRKPFGAAECGASVSLSLVINTEEAVEKARVMLWQGEALSPRYYEMTEDAEHPGTYRAAFKTPEEGILLWYCFEISSESGTVYYGARGDGRGGEGRLYEASPACWQITVYRPSEVPSWYKDGIVYQIFPDRFARDEGWRERVEAANEAVNARRSDIRRTVQEDWYRTAYYGRDDKGRVTEWPMPGGSLRGIEEKLDYIRSLGVTAIYLNPIFEAVSNHRYDTADYMRIDPALGTDEDFRSLCASAKARGIRIILDGVFSHTGVDSKYFRNNSSWYKWDENEATGYKSWWGVEDLPEVDEDDPEFRELILGEDGVVAHWLRMGASGWRLDVADELPDSFIEETRKRIRETCSDGVLIGEVWEDASNKVSYGETRRYLLGDELDSTMNYPLRDILLDYINYTITSDEAADRLADLEEHYPRENFYGALNLIGSHDRERILTAMAAAEDYDSAAGKVKVLSALEYALPGVPCVYYGDEAGLAGGRDPENRSGFPWGREDRGLAYHYRMLGLIYDEHPALKGGSFETLSLGDDIFAFVRRGRDAGGAEETLLVLANRSYGETYVDLGAAEGIRGGYALELLTSTEVDTDENGSLGWMRMDRLSVKMISIRDRAPEREDLGRDAGVICHISSLGKPGFGKKAKDFVDFISDAGFGVWQILPLNPAGTGSSPYSSNAAFAGEAGFIDRDDPPSKVGFREFIRKNAYWLKDYIAYTVIKESHDRKPWYEWPDRFKFADPQEILVMLTDEEEKRANQLANEQYIFDRQWSELKEYANAKGIRIMGDLPMYMAADSADVWANKNLFRMDEFGRQKVRAGVPPDAFSGIGQDWANPLYDWDEMKRTGYEWWLNRMRQCAERYDILRIDHFRGLSEYFAIPEGGKPTDGVWQHGPGLELFSRIRSMLKEEALELKLFAEDLGYLDAGVKNLLKLTGLPGMDIWQFNAEDMRALCRKDPGKAARRAFYSGTHDNNTLVGFLKETDPYGDAEAKAFDVIKELYLSPACLAVVQMQDVLMLDETARMNVPGVPDGNWKWTLGEGGITEAFPDAEKRSARFREMAEEGGRR